MTPESISSGVFSFEEVQALREATKFVSKLQVSNLRSHELARAVAKQLQIILSQYWSVKDGTYGAIEHSWLVSPVDSSIILDVASPVRLPEVQLINTVNQDFPEYSLYSEGKLREDIDGDQVLMLATVVD